MIYFQKISNICINKNDQMVYLGVNENIGEEIVDLLIEYGADVCIQYEILSTKFSLQINLYRWIKLSTRLMRIHHSTKLSTKVFEFINLFFKFVMM